MKLLVIQQSDLTSALKLDFLTCGRTIHHDKFTEGNCNAMSSSFRYFVPFWYKDDRVLHLDGIRIKCMREETYRNFDVLLAVNLSIILVIDQLNT